ncbi:MULTISPECIES: alpha-L-rhamnosidase [Petrotoga]|uniref:alpha-L-rhamnosidase n=2 Tax=Petrotoga sibirica TaxID=156202 RepID=A0A4R8EUN0_9BACT|nr:MULTISPECIES: alpha-L-rhamnosidase [Petrotoga]POZ89398.1 alpha-L-rhamnosidase [Petrotoga sibirica DSM 13575]POZ91922.1 alpha-L-rhamnosidase [Petrotoga sp. SL27]TDX16294.1 alpha-L-rhamnosidase [Petrotoga sibirica]
MNFYIASTKVNYSANPLALKDTRPRLSWVVETSEKRKKQSAYRVLISSSQQLIEQGEGNIWDTHKIESEDNYCYYSGEELESFKRYYWKVKIWDEKGEESTWSKVSFFETGPLSKSDWKAKWITKRDLKTFYSAGDFSIEKFKHYHAAYFRKTFEIKNEIQSARAYISGLGFYELYLNGEKVGNNVLDPGQSEYSKEALFNVYNIISFLTGQNCVGVILGNGRHLEQFGYSKPKLIIQILVEYVNGEKEYILSDESWASSHGPLQENGIYYGEKYNRTLEMPGWNTYHFDASNWEEVEITKGPNLRYQNMPPIRVTKILKPKKIYSLKPGVFVYDFGQNFTGWVKISVSGPKGAQLKLRHSELVNEDGSLKTNTIRKAEATDTYILKGEGKESYEPRFTYHGFRYVEVSGSPFVPTIENIEGRFVHSDVEKVGDFYCSNELINKIHKNILWGQLSNLHSIPTDCPQRDERFGWMGDAQLSAEEAIYNFDMSLFYENYLQEIKLSQKEDGSISDVVPAYIKLYPADPAWGTAYITIAWYLYKYYKNEKVLSDHYESMKKYVEFLHKSSENNLLKKLGKFGDWCPPGTISPKKTPVEFTSTWYYYNDVYLFSKIAEVLGKEKDAQHYFELSENIKKSFNDYFLKDYGYESRMFGPVDRLISQTSQILPLYYNMVPNDKKEFILEKLINNIVEHQDSHLDTGIVGTRYLFDVLSENGYSDLAFRIATQESYPSWGYMIKEGATTVWERWEKLEAGGMNSQNHIMLGSVDTFFYKYLAGISLDKDGWKKARIKPHLVGEERFASAKIKTIIGEFQVSWEKGENLFKLSVVIPFGTEADVFIPKLWNEFNLKEERELLFDNEQIKDFKERNSIKLKEYNEENIILNLGSGQYYFELEKK